MKVKLLKRFLNNANRQITVYSITTNRGCVTGMSYGYNDDRYAGLFSWGDDEEDVMRKVRQIYWKQVREKFYKKYRKK